ncbi:MAG TPA: peptidase [Saprospiraceae bacterium]|nr:peptidase [Saprospiraceae bacterium]
MTYCLGIKTKNGLIALSDTRITSGSETTTSKKVYTVNKDKHSFFIMTSGLRSVRDKAITYFKDVIDDPAKDFNKLYKLVNEFGGLVKQVASEDRTFLETAGLNFNLYSIIGGQLKDDESAKMYLLYPEGNWIEVRTGTPFVAIGNSGAGSPILRRSLKYEDDLEYALKCGFLAFDAARISVNDVDFPIHTVVLENNSYFAIEKKFTEKDLRDVSEYWNEKLKEAIIDLPSDVLNRAFESELIRI